jgi:hypothetical protein
MKSRTTYWAVTHSENDPKTGLGAIIPTLGNPTSASDMYRVKGYTTTGHEGWNSCFTDINTCSSLAKLIEGEISSWRDIRAAETALQLIMWHARVDILIPGFKQEFNSGFQSYVRCDQKRSQLSFDLFKPLQPYDQIYAVESVKIDGGIILESNFQESNIVGKTTEQSTKSYMESTQHQVSVMSSIALEFGVPAYFTNPLLESGFDRAGYFYRLYQSINSDWNNFTFTPPIIESNILLPPLLSIVLTRAKSRDSIPEAIVELRDELQVVRNEIESFNSMISGAYNQVELEKECKRVSESFESAFSASRYDGSKVIFPLLKLREALTKPFHVLRGIFDPNFVPHDPRIVANRTLTGKMFSNLLITDSMHSLLTHYFTSSEIKALERDANTERHPNKSKHSDSDLPPIKRTQKFN